MSYLRSVVALTAVISSVAMAQGKGDSKFGACLKAADTFEQTERARVRAAGGHSLSAMRQTRDSMIVACKTAFPVSGLTKGDLLLYAGLFYGGPDRDSVGARMAIDKALADKQLSMKDRAEALILASQLATALAERPSAEARARADAYLAQVDAMPAAFLPQKLKGHQNLQGYYRGMDIGDGIEKEGRILLGLADKLNASDADLATETRVSAYMGIAEVFGDRGQQDSVFHYFDKALEANALRKKGQFRDFYAKSIPVQRARYELLGKPAPAIVGDHWLNAPEGTGTMDLKGKVTLLEFTAHW